MNDLVQQNASLKQPASSHSERQGKTWHSLCEIYGTRWIRENGEAPGRVWGSMINALTDHEIAATLAHLVKNPRKDGRGNIHPPSAPEFWEVAKAGAPRAYPAITHQEQTFSNYAIGANFRLMKIVMRERGMPDIKAMVKEKNRIVADYDLMSSDGHDIEWDDFITVIDERLELTLKASKIP